MTHIFPRTFSLLSAEQKEILAQELTNAEPTDAFWHELANLGKQEAPAYLPDMAQLEWAIWSAEQGKKGIPQTVDCLTVNPTLSLLTLAWQGLPQFLRGNAEAKVPVPGEEHVMVWFAAEGGNTCYRRAGFEDLLVLKMVVEDVSAHDAAELGNVAVGRLDAALDRAVYREILLAPPSKIRRDPASFALGNTDERFLSAQVFTLQWHITQACDLHCKHCYDRSDRTPLPLEKGLAVLDDLRAFCKERNVSGQVTFTGGNPLLYPHFFELYQAATDRDLMVAILGNPAPRAQLERMLAIQEPAFYQVSLEGLTEHNDYIRGKGYFQRVLSFLEVLQKLNIYSMVMLTLTSANKDQVVPLAEVLRDKVDLFVFNRLAMVGEGAFLQSVPVAEYPEFLEQYLEAQQENPCMGIKDNMINIVRHKKGITQFGGCAGFGCSAAFNFLSLLPDGEVHACRKFPSYIGNIFEQPLAQIYDSEKAQQYRAGSSACKECEIRATCGGCLAVVHGWGKDVFKDKDPYCFMPE